MCQELTSPPSPAPHRFLPHRPAALSPHTPHCPLLAARPGTCAGLRRRPFLQRTNRQFKRQKAAMRHRPPPAARAPRAPPARVRTQPRARPRRLPPPRGPFSPGAVRRGRARRGARRGPAELTCGRTSGGARAGRPGVGAERRRVPETTSASRAPPPPVRARPRRLPRRPGRERARPRAAHLRPRVPGGRRCPRSSGRVCVRARFPRPAMSHRAELPRSEGA